MWYFTWMLGVGFAVLLAIINALWLESDQALSGEEAETGTGHTSA